jgi:hypothetical protein
MTSPRYCIDRARAGRFRLADGQAQLGRLCGELFRAQASTFHAPSPGLRGVAGPPPCSFRRLVACVVPSKASVIPTPCLARWSCLCFKRPVWSRPRLAMSPQPLSRNSGPMAAACGRHQARGGVIQDGSRLGCSGVNHSSASAASGREYASANWPLPADAFGLDPPEI